jgi:hypothetical protein
MRVVCLSLVIGCMILTACGNPPNPDLPIDMSTSETPRAGHWSGEFSGALGSKATVEFDVKTGLTLSNLVLTFGDFCTVRATQDVVLPANPTVYVELKHDHPDASISMGGRFDSTISLAGNISGRCGGQIVAMGTFSAKWQQ